MALDPLIRLSHMGKEENIDSDIGYQASLKMNMATWPFLKIDMEHGDPLLCFAAKCFNTELVFLYFLN